MPPEAGEVLVMIHHQARDEAELAAVREAYHVVSRRLADVPGMLANELLQSALDPSALTVVSRWADLAAFQSWEEGAGHRADTAPLRPYRDTRLSAPFGIYRVDAAY
ncbi:antibiotic biosynthesis monooxygenase [Streptomyces sp. So13.3]|uniref:antibiotic biosynthesis monooxygenase family protein n=1 Tax=Streptomyces TaxID=1883 RepID=UPI001105F333|nr:MULTISPECIES: antibiotic biosynthesis monooxygenase family protein [Streptomyces]MCZ4097862.1 antibiotic biosynthesis monooxygenase [Streptomyces sp. H39-C1]QNA76731.1 antibiotic biosynthesis monooxygenase [Streptomyces sp. So13.3]